MNDIEHLARVLPAPVESDLAPDRHRLLKEHLMREFTQPTTSPPSHRVRWLVPVAVAAAAAVAAGGVVLAIHHSATPDRATAVAGPAVSASSGPATPAARLLDRVALAAAKTPAVKVGPHQFVYVSSVVSYLVEEDNGGPGKVWTEPVHHREIWLPNDPSMPGLIKENGSTQPLPAGGDTNAGLVGSLPADPQKLKAMAYEETKGKGHGPDLVAFDWIADHLRESLPSPQVSAALYRAASLIPGVSLVDDAVDAAGRHGVAVGLFDSFDGQRSEWIFDPVTFAYLGEHNVQIREQDGIAPGTITGQSAVLLRAAVDHAGQVPAK